MIAAFAVTLYTVENRRAEAAVSVKPYVWTEEECMSCHSREELIRLKASKRGDPSYCKAANQLLSTPGK